MKICRHVETHLDVTAPPERSWQRHPRCPLDPLGHWEPRGTRTDMGRLYVCLTWGRISSYFPFLCGRKWGNIPLYGFHMF